MTDRPNLLFLFSDQHNPAVLGCYGDSLVKTPHLDSLASQGVVLDHVYCPSPLCVPSRMSMLTGRHPYENQVWTNDHTLGAGCPTFAHSLGASGYRPALIGRLHALGPDQLLGYAERMVGDHGPNYLGGGRGKGGGHGMLNGTAGPDRVSLELSGQGQSGYQVHDEAVTAAAVDYLQQVGKSTRHEGAEPFCLTVGFMLPHQPYVAQKTDYDLYRDSLTPPQYPEEFSPSLHPYLRWWRERCGIMAVSASETHRSRAAYWALVTRLDALIGEILTALHESGLADNTLIVYSSDHGDQLGEHGLWWKQTFYEGSVTVPGIITWPGVLPAGARCDRVISSLDLPATMLEALGAPPLPRSHGRSLLPLLRGDHPDWEDTAFSEFCTDDGWYMRMIRSGDWKLCYYDGAPPQLFNLAEDPHENTDRAQDPACRPVLEELTRRVLVGWDPDRIAGLLAIKRQERDIFRSWGRCVEPPDRFRWGLQPEMSYLDPEP